MPNLEILLFAIAAGLSIIFLVLFILEQYKNSQLKKTIEDLTSLEKPEKGLEALSVAIKRSQEIISEAETESIKIVSDNRHQTQNLTKDYIEELQNASLDIKNQLAQELRLSVDEFKNYLNELKSLTNESQERLQNQLKGQVNTLLANFEQNLTDFTQKTEKQTTSSVELELKSARSLVESYKQQQLSLVDENIIALLEKTLSLVLAKKLSLKDQLDLVYEALEKAIADKFIV